MLDLKRALGAVTRIVFSLELSPDYPRKPVQHPSLPAYRPERRRFARHETEIILAATAANGATYRGYCRDMSDKGMAALIWGELNVGEEVCLTYRRSGDSASAVVSAVVRYRIGFRYGLEVSPEPEWATELTFQRLGTSSALPLPN